MSVLAVRPASAADLESIGRISAARPFTAKWSPSALEAELERPDSLFLVVGIPGAVLGYALARSSGREARLLDLAVLEDGRGAGRAAFSALATAAKARGAGVLTFEVSDKNARALAFYARAGAKVVGRRPKFYNDGTDAVLMDLDIP